MKMKHTTDSSEKEIARFDYLLKRKTLELDKALSELSGQKEVNSICAAIIMYLLSRWAREKDGVLTSEINKAAVADFVGKYYAVCEDGGDNYKVNFTERDCDK
jgi:hypothetical protein